MENKQALKLIEKIQNDLAKNKFNASDISTNLKEIRSLSLELNNPVVTKALRLAYEHLEHNTAFLIGIPDDEPVDADAVQLETIVSVENNIESLQYFLSLFIDLNKKNNILDLREYNAAFLAL